jgi:hypothetical protein
MKQLSTGLVNLQKITFCLWGTTADPFLDRAEIFLSATTSRLVLRHKQVMKLTVKLRNNSIKSHFPINLQDMAINPLNAELNPICHLLALLEGATIVDISRVRVNEVRGQICD